ncbi:HAD-like domain-containing protein [Aspergillus tamarii]|uniref:HAD-like domain-containing protein n=1 Tax=Aspergillus tamarii TaxID=41984 RepID=A0A5N6UBM9_ASPTM|nr:HAD-like domain-containing protein [Aspergillus tamarii]
MTQGKLPQYKAIIFDLGDTVILAQIFKRILTSQTWSDYERGNLNEDTIMSMISDIRATANHIAIFAMSNISQPDYAALLHDHPEMRIFDRVFPSGCHRTRKPEVSFYNKVLREIDTPLEKVIFIDDKLENVISAQSVGMHGIVYTNAAEVGRQFRNLIFDPVERGREFLRCNAGELHSITETNQIVRENFSQLLILEATGDKSLVSLEYHQKSWNFLQGSPILTTEIFPDDVDTTSLALMTLLTDGKTANLLLDHIFGLVNADGIVTTCFDQTREQTDPVVCANVLRLFCTYDRGTAFPLTVQWVYNVLMHRAYLNGTRYYTSPESFLYFVGQLCRFSTDVLELRPLEKLLIDRLKERIQVKADPLSLAMRILTCLSVGVSQIEVDLRELLAMQCEDGSWEPCPFTRYGSSEINIGNRGLTTALAIKAVEMCRGS